MPIFESDHPPLLRLRNGRWVNPCTVTAVIPLERSDDYPGMLERVVVYTTPGTAHVVSGFATFEHTIKYADDLAAQVNRWRMSDPDCEDEAD